MTPAQAGRFAGICWRHSAPALSFAWGLTQAAFSLAVLAVVLTARFVLERRRSIFRGFLYALAGAYVAAEATYHAGRRVRASLARLRGFSPISGMPAVQALRQALMRFLARRYSWRLS